GCPLDRHLSAADCHCIDNPRKAELAVLLEPVLRDPPPLGSPCPRCSTGFLRIVGDCVACLMCGADWLRRHLSQEDMNIAARMSGQTAASSYRVLEERAVVQS